MLLTPAKCGLLFIEGFAVVFCQLYGKLRDNCPDCQKVIENLHSLDSFIKFSKNTTKTYTNA